MDECVFCRLLVTGEADWVVQEGAAVAFSPLPGEELAPGHTLVVPRTHCVGVLDAPFDALQATVGLVQRVGRALQDTLGATGVVVLNASGPGSGQTIGHLHFHVVPCWPDDGVTFWPEGRSVHQVDGGEPVHRVLAAAVSVAPRGPGLADGRNSLPV